MKSAIHWGLGRISHFYICEDSAVPRVLDRKLNCRFVNRLPQKGLTMHRQRLLDEKTVREMNPPLQGMGSFFGSRDSDSRATERNKVSTTPGPRHLVVLDLDGTITKSDTLVPFLIGCFLRHPRFRLRLLLLPLDVLRFLTGKLAATGFKERLLTAFIGGLRVEAVDAWARKFAAQVIRSGCNGEILSLIEQSKQRGDRLVVVSASLDMYVAFIADNLGICETVSTVAEVESGRYSGRIIGENCKGPEKLYRLQQHLSVDQHRSMVTALGNDESDLPLLEWADEGWIVRRGRFDKVIPQV